MKEIIGENTPCEKCASLDWRPTISLDVQNAKVNIQVMCAVCKWKAFSANALVPPTANITFSD